MSSIHRKAADFLSVGACLLDRALESKNSRSYRELEPWRYRSLRFLFTIADLDGARRRLRTLLRVLTAWVEADSLESTSMLTAFAAVPEFIVVCHPYVLAGGCEWYSFRDLWNRDPVV